MKKRGPSPQIKEFVKKYKAQMQKVQTLHMKLRMHAAKNTHVWGLRYDHHVTVDVDNDLWYEFNSEYYKLREMGFTDDARSLELLERYQGRMERVVNVLAGAD